MLTAEQIELRKTGIGSSEIGAVVGVDPWKSPIDVYLEKMGMAEPRSTEQTDVGQEFEDQIARLAIRKIGTKTAKYGETMRHPRVEIALATPDFLVEPRTILECKNVGYRMMHHWDRDLLDDRGVPPYYLCQVQWQMEVCDVDLAIVAALLGGRDLCIYRIPRDVELGEQLLAAGVAFWTRHIIVQDPPPVDGSASANRWLNKRFPSPSEAIIEASAYQRAIVAKLKQARSQWAEVDAALELAEQRVKEQIGEAAGIETELGRITWRKDRVGKVGWRQVAIAAGAGPELIEQHRSPAGRRFSVPREWGRTEEDGNE